MSKLTPNEPVNVLLIEDNPGDVRLTQEAFRTVDSEFVFHTLSDGADAQRFFEGDGGGPPVCPDLVLLDLNLPRVDGFEVLETLQRELEYPPPPVLVLSSSDEEDDIVGSYERAANAYLQKPATVDEFDDMARAIDDFWVQTVQHPPAPA